MIVCVSVIVCGLGPQLKVITPPLATAATKAAEVQLAGVPLPTTRAPVVSAAGAGSTQLLPLTHEPSSIFRSQSLSLPSLQTSGTHSVQAGSLLQSGSSQSAEPPQSLSMPSLQISTALGLTAGLESAFNF